MTGLLLNLSLFFLLISVDFMEKLLKVEQVAELLQVSKRTIYDWKHVDYILHYKFKKGVRFRESEIDRWLKIRSVKAEVICKLK